jgi:uncharacterized alpha-E superfamily protein
MEKAIGHKPALLPGRRAPDLHSSISSLLIDQTNPVSVARCIGLCRANALAVRESIPPEVWSVINRLHHLLASTTSGHTVAGPGPAIAVQALTEEFLIQFDALAGAASRNLLRADGWHFWMLGVHLERAVTTLLVSREAFQPRRVAKANVDRQSEETVDCLLRLLACQYAYRSLFQTRPTVANAAALILQDPQLPRSVRFCAERILENLRTVLAGGSSDASGTPVKMAARLAADIEFAELKDFFPSGDQEPDRRLGLLIEQMGERFSQLAVTISDHYLHHQAFNILR